MFRNRVLAAGAALLLAAALASAQQPPTSVYVVTYLEVRVESASAGEALTRQYIRDTRADTGNFAAYALQELFRSNRFVVLESWRDQASFKTHEAAPHTLDFRHQLTAIHQSPYDQRVNHGFSIDPRPAVGGGGALYVMTHVDVPGPHRDQAEALLKPLAARGRIDKGNLGYDVYQQIEPRLNHFQVLAVWKSRRAFEAYEDTADWLSFREALEPLLGALYDERLYTTLGNR
jgi:quinol monooxygenase YgiN